MPTSTDESELCINGMSFSKRSSKWANSALVVTVPSADFDPLIGEHGPLAGIAFQVRFPHFIRDLRCCLCLELYKLAVSTI